MAQGAYSTPHVQAVMRDRGVGWYEAQKILKRERLAAHDTSDVTANQKAEVLGALINGTDEDRRNVLNLHRALHARGSTIPAHDVTKVLWALQKQEAVKFRERESNGNLFVLRVTSKGYDLYARMTNGHARAPHPLIEEAVASVALDHGDMQTQVVATTKPSQEEPVQVQPPVHITAYPSIAAVLSKAATAEKLNAAASLLAEAGVEDVALEVMERAAMSPFEREVVEFVSTMQQAHPESLQD